MSRCYPVTVVTAPHALLLIETGIMHDGEPVFALAWTEGHGSDPDGPIEGNRCGPRPTLNRNIAGLPAVTPEADQ